MLIIFRLLITKMGNRSSACDIRVVTAGEISKENRRRDNRITTSKYTIILFPLQNLFEQFRRVANIYFLIISSLGFIIDSPVNPATSIAALAFVLLVTMMKQGYEDWLRHRADYLVNNEKVTVIRQNKMETKRFHQIRPGDLIKLEKESNVPCDALLLWSSDHRGKCFVNTANLDGETSLKPLKVPSLLLDSSIEILSSTKIKIECREPIADIYTFNGKIALENGNNNEDAPLGIDNLFLRGSRIKNTEWAICCALYTGKETKLSLNSRITRNKFTSCEAYINKFLFFYLFLLILEVLICFLLKRYLEYLFPMHLQYVGEYNSDWSFSSIAQDVFSFVLLYNYCIPISLYVSIEFHKFIGASYFNWDSDLVCSETGQSAFANTSDLNEELGQIEILFSDKTGTLTKNDMYFQTCSVDGKLYLEHENKLFEIDEDFQKSSRHEIDILEIDLDFFFTTLALCHTVQIEENIAKRNNEINIWDEKQLNSHTNKGFVDDYADLPIYQSMSSDEIAFVKAAANRGIIFCGEEMNEMHLKRRNGEIEIFKKLQVLEFTSARKRMSVIVRNKCGKIFLLCKGADCSVIPLCKNSSANDISLSHLKLFAKRGLRTLVVAYKELTEIEYLHLTEEIIRMNMSLDGQGEENDKWKALESGLILLGVTGVEDRLQDNVSETLVALREAGLRIWVLTGDKVETAINVAQSCEHIPPGSEKLFLTDVWSSEELESRLHKYKDEKFKKNSHLTLVLDGNCFSMIVRSQKEKDFVEIALHCKAVICCRLSPLQKAQIVRLIKKSPGRPVTAAIGDGANDISMIQEAHVGFGLYGTEGRQAARCADFAFKNFMMLKKILLVHGHWYYQRLGTLVQFSFYKNMAFVSLMLFYQMTTLFSTQAIFDSMFLMMFNLIFSSVPIVVLSLSEHCHPPDQLMNEPALYKKQVTEKALSWINFTGWSILGVYHAAIIFSFVFLTWFINPVISLDGRVAGLWCYGTAMLHCLIVLVNCKVLIGTRYNTIVLILTSIGSIGVWILFSNLYSYFYLMFDGDVFWTFIRLEESITFWLLNLIILMCCLLPDYCTFAYKSSLKNGNFWNRKTTEITPF